MKKEAILYEKLDNRRVHCFLCAHQCRIADSSFGVCGVRQNIAGILYTHVYGAAISRNIDPVEKKPLYHFLPGSNSYSIATIGCNFKCGFCQNWQISQLSKKERKNFGEIELSPEDIIKEAKRNGCKSISYTYTEPTIFFEYAYDTAKLAKQAGLRNNFVTNGYMTKEALDIINPYLDAANIDLKSFREEFYRKICKAHLKPVLESIRYMKQLNIWVEVTTLIVPGKNDSEEELNDIAMFIAGVGKDIPWHISRFYPNYEFTDIGPTSIEVMRNARRIGLRHGLRYVYLGNVIEDTNTNCYNCGSLLVKRDYLTGKKCNIRNGSCPECGSDIAGIWN